MTDDIVAALAGPGWGVFHDFLTGGEVTELRAEAELLRAAGRFRRAGVGRGAAVLRDDIRGDEVCWIEPGLAGPATDALLTRFESLRLEINRALMLGLFDAELHFARYAPGAGYRRHLDRFRDDDRRTLTLIVYLNADWHPEHGGQLRFWSSAERDPLDIAPRGGTLVAFLSDRFWHEVAPARHERWSVTGWYRRR